MTHEDKWQPIATAPRDGTIVDLWIQRENGQGERFPDMSYFVGDVAKANDWVSEPFDFGLVSDMQLSLEQVTHWMPLPEAPKQSQE